MRKSKQLEDHEAMLLKALEGVSCDWTDCGQPAVEVVRGWLLCVRHATAAKAVPASCAIGDW